MSYVAFFSHFMPAESKKLIKENSVASATSESGPGNTGKESVESCRMQSQEKSAFLSPSPGFTNHLLVNESDCTEHRDDPGVHNVIQA